MMKAALIAGAVATAALAAFACSSSSSGGGGGSSCLASSQSSQACTSCVESKCSSQVSSTESGCSDLINCECPGGTYNASLAQSCSAKAQESSCQTPVQALIQCQSQNCQTECASSSSSGGSGSGSSSGSGGTPTGTCATLATCCASMPANQQSGCNTVASYNNQSACQSTLSAYDDAGVCH